MITLQKVAVYRKYKGDIDLWVKNDIEKDKNVMNDNDWYLIDILLSDMVLIENNLASKDFKAKKIQFIHDNTANEEVILLLKLESKKHVHVFKKIRRKYPIVNTLVGVVKLIFGYLIFRLIVYWIMKYFTD